MCISSSPPFPIACLLAVVLSLFTLNRGLLLPRLSGLGQPRGRTVQTDQRAEARQARHRPAPVGADYTQGLKHIVLLIRDLPAVNKKGHLFVIIGVNTFSAAMANADHFRYQTNAILVGQAIGEKPNSYQEPREFTLPNSHWTVRYSTKYYTFVEDGENIIRPDQEIEGTWDDYTAGRDRTLDWVLQYKGN